MFYLGIALPPRFDRNWALVALFVCWASPLGWRLLLHITTFKFYTEMYLFDGAFCAGGDRDHSLHDECIAHGVDHLPPLQQRWAHGASHGAHRLGTGRESCQSHWHTHTLPVSVHTEFFLLLLKRCVYILIRTVKLPYLSAGCQLSNFAWWQPILIWRVDVYFGEYKICASPPQKWEPL